MLTIISGTDRKGSSTSILAQHYHRVLSAKTTKTVQLFSLENLPSDLYGNAMYGKDTLSSAFVAIEEQYLISAEKLLFVVPEYNGSFPGILKLFIDACSIRSKMAIFKGKKVALVGVATGRAGNLRGLDHLASILTFMGVHLYPSLLPISTFNKLLDAEKNINDEGTLKAIEQQIDGFLSF